jgi:hypothetical protein
MQLFLNVFVVIHIRCYHQRDELVVLKLKERVRKDHNSNWRVVDFEHDLNLIPVYTAEYQWTTGAFSVFIIMASSSSFCFCSSLPL